MDTLNGLIISLGINPTLWVQLAIFLVTFAVLNFVVFKPYFKAFEERERRTVGSKEGTEQILIETSQLQSQYETEARQINDQIKSVFDLARQTAVADQAKIVNEARDQSAEKIKFSRADLEREIVVARQTLRKDITDIGSSITEKLIGKEASL
jgi:F-type H+-transporting ATPase subunit b